MSDSENGPNARRRYKAPYTAHRPIPTIEHYEREKEERKANAGTGDKNSRPIGESDNQEHDAANRYLYSAEHSDAGSDNSDVDRKSRFSKHGSTSSQKKDKSQQLKSRFTGGGARSEKDLIDDTSQAPLEDAVDPKHKRKAIGKRRGERAPREVTDPVTHLPVRIHDLQNSDLKKVPENVAPPGVESRTATGLAGKRKTDAQLADEEEELQRHHEAMENLFPPPEFDAIEVGLAKIQRIGLTIGVAAAVVFSTVFVAVDRMRYPRAPAETGFSWSTLWTHATGSIYIAICAALVALVVLGIRKWMDHKVHDLWEEEIWHAQKHDYDPKDESQETTHWLNNVLSSIWPLVNPDLFVSLADTLEDVMQASLPSVVRMVSIEDIGQGSESIRILGVRWLPTAAAARSVGSDGKLSDRSSDKPNDRSCPGEGEIDESTNDEEKQAGNNDDKQGPQQQQEPQVAEGMEAEEGDFFNVEIAFAYRTRSSSKKFKDRAKHAHLFISFYLPGNIKIPVYVDLKGIVGILRCRMQLTPDPPFFALCTFTLLGQPTVDVACTPLTKKGLNIMDLPLISHFVQSSIDAAVAEYVAPKSMTLDLKDMLNGEDFKKDTRARGVIVAKIKRAFDFKEGDPGIPLIREGSADPYITVGWAKFVKPLWSTRVILSEMEPHWNETAFILVTPDELNVDERLRVQLWDSDRFTADDDLGRIEMDLKDVMRNPETRGRMMDRVDGFKALHAGEGVPGKLEWSVGYFPKAHITEAQMQSQTFAPEIRGKEKLEEVVEEACRRKLREAKKDESDEMEQLKLQQHKELEDQMIVSTPPAEEYPSGILAIQIHEATGLEVRAHHNADRHNNGPEPSGYEETGDELPSTYCNIILNHQKIYRTRVKPKNAKPFFNAGTERFIRDWRTTEVYVSVRDARVHEDDCLMGIVRLPLADVFKHRSQTNITYPLYGGVGYGRVRISLVFRAVTSQIPRNLLGWEWGTLIIQPEIKGIDLPQDLQHAHLKVQTSINSAHMRSSGHLQWKSRNNRILHIGVRRRYCSVLVIQFRKDSHFVDKTAGFAVLWLSDIPDGDKQDLRLDVWKGDLKRATTCHMDSYGEKVGSINIKLEFCRGLSKYHYKVAKHDKHLSDVFQVVETARYQFKRSEQDDDSALKNPAHDGNSSADSSSDSDSDNDKKSNKRHSKTLLRTGTSVDHDGDDPAEHGSRNIFDSIHEYKDHRKQINRRHRGLMQFKTARTMWWMKHKAEHLQDRISGVFEHHERSTGIETEA